MANIIEIVVRAIDQASATLKSTAQSMVELEDAAKKAAIPFAGLAAVGTAVIAKTTLTAARTEELGVVVENLGKVSGKSKAELEKTESSIENLGITTQASRAIMAQMMGAELDLARATDIARAAQDLAVISMQDSSDAARDMLYAVTSLQPRVLRKYGIFVDLNDIYKETAESLGKNVDELTEAERRTGMLNAMLEQAANYTGTYEAAMETAGKQLRSMARYTEEAANELGEHYLPYLGMAVEAVSDALQAFKDLDDRTQAVIASTIMYSTVIAASIAATMGAVVATSKLIQALESLKLVMATHPLLFIPTALAVLATAALQSKAAFEEQKKAARESATTLEEYKKGVDALIPVIPEASAHVRGFARDAMIAAHETAALTAEQEWNKEEQKELADAVAAGYDNWEKLKEEIEGTGDALSDTADVMAQEMLLALGAGTLDLRENIRAYEELQDKVVAVYANTTDTINNFNKWRESQEKGLQDKLADLEEKRQEKIAWVLAGAHARTFEQNEEALAYWNARYDKERDKLIETVNEKIAARETEKNDDIAKAQAAAAERTRLAEEAKAAELAAMEAAQKERLALFALEMAEYQGLLQIPIKGYEDMAVSAQEYYDLAQAGIIQIPQDLQTFMTQALDELEKGWISSGEESETFGDTLNRIFTTAVGDVMNLGVTTDEETQAMHDAFKTKIETAITDTTGVTGDFTKAIEDSGTETDQLKNASRQAHATMQGHIKKSIKRMDDYTDSIRNAIEAFNRLNQLEGGGGLPEMQFGMPYVPATMPVIVHKGETILSVPQAERYRTGGGGQAVTINNYLGGVYGVDGFEAALDEALRDARRFSR